MNQIDHSSLCGRRVTFPRWPPCASIASRYISHLRPVSFTLRDGFDTHHLVGHFCKLFSENVCLYVCTEQSCYFIIFTLFGCSIQRNSSGLLVHFLISVLENIDTEIFCYPKHVFLLMPLIFVMKFVSVSVIIINIIIIIIIWNGHLSSMCEHVLLAPLLFFFVLNLYLLALAPSIAPLGAIRSQVKSRGFFCFRCTFSPTPPAGFLVNVNLALGP